MRGKGAQTQSADTQACYGKDLRQVGAIDRRRHGGRAIVVDRTISEGDFARSRARLHRQRHTGAQAGGFVDDVSAKAEIERRFGCAGSPVAAEGHFGGLAQPGCRRRAVDRRDDIAGSDGRDQATEHAPHDHMAVTGCAKQHAQALAAAGLGADKANMLIFQGRQSRHQVLAIGNGRRRICRP